MPLSPTPDKLSREWMLPLRVERAMAQLLESRGGTLRAAEVAELLGVGQARQAQVVSRLSVRPAHAAGVAWRGAGDADARYRKRLSPAAVFAEPRC